MSDRDHNTLTTAVNTQLQGVTLQQFLAAVLPTLLTYAEEAYKLHGEKPADLIWDLADQMEELAGGVEVGG